MPGPSGVPTATKASQSLAPPSPFVSVAVTCPPPGTVVALTVISAEPDGGGGSGTVTGGLVASRVKLSFGKKRNSYCPGVVGTVTVHVRVVTPAPT